MNSLVQFGAEVGLALTTLVGPGQADEPHVGAEATTITIVQSETQQPGSEDAEGFTADGLMISLASIATIGLVLVAANATRRD